MSTLVPVLCAAIPFALATARAGVSVTTAPRIAARTAIAATIAFALWLAILLVRTREAMFLVSFITIPVAAGLFGGGVFFFAWALVHAIAAIRGGQASAPYALLADAVVIAGIVFTINYALTDVRLSRIASAQPDDLRTIYETNRGDRVITAAIASRGGTPPDVLAAIASDPSPELRRDPQGYRDLVRDDRKAVLVHVAENPSTPPAALARLIHDPATRVADAAARNPHTPLEAISDQTSTTPPQHRGKSNER
jgi:hypothetical protein